MPRYRLCAGTALVVACLLALPPIRHAFAQTSPPPSQGADLNVPNSGFATGPSQQVSNPGVGPLFGAPFAGDHLLGDWAGLRPWLQDHGVEIDLDWLSESAGNISGGQRERFDFSSQVGLEVDLDLGRILGVQGAAFHVMIVNGNGRNLSTDALGDDLDQTQEIYGGRGNVVAHMVYAYAEQALADNRIDIAAGWLPVGTYFAASPLYCDFMNVLACGNPHPVPNYPGEPDWPQASFGGMVRFAPTPSFYGMIGLFSVDTDFGTGGGGISGWAWAVPHKSGVSIPVELGYVPRFGRDQLIGHYKIGFDQDTHEYNLISSTNAPNAGSHHRQTYYLLIDQMLMRQGKGETDGLIVFGGLTHATDKVSPLTRQVFAGVTSTGAAWGRSDDTVGLAWNWIEMSGAYTAAEEELTSLGGSTPFSLDGFGPAYAPQNTEQVIEVNYAAKVYPGVTVMPDFQYIIRPGGTSLTRNAAVLGLRTNVNF